MKLLRCLPFASLCTVALLFAAATSAHAQLSIYATYSGVRLSNLASSTSSTSSYWANGFGGGATFTVLPLGPVSISLDLRGSTRPGTPGADTALGGVKLGVRLPVIRLKPYLQASGGYVGTRAAAAGSGATATARFAAYEILGGIDYSVFPHIDVRLIEIGGGQGISVNGANNGSNLSLLTIGSGLVLHF